MNNAIQGHVYWVCRVWTQQRFGLENKTVYCHGISGEFKFSYRSPMSILVIVKGPVATVGHIKTPLQHLNGPAFFFNVKPSKLRQRKTLHFL